VMAIAVPILAGVLLSRLQMRGKAPTSSDTPYMAA
jgi:hypothetical protein